MVHISLKTYTFEKEKSFEKANLKGMNIVGALIKDYQLLGVYFLDSFIETEIRNQIIVTNKNIHCNNLTLIYNLQNEGAVEFEEQYVQHAVFKLTGDVKESSKVDENGKRTNPAEVAKSKARKRLKKVLEENAKVIEIKKLLTDDVCTKFEEIFNKILA